ncbi:MAG: insulinase family protein [Phycisphaeraceae bacterium]|nr:insulinase family protein [Phycisphaeraceae bacterium]
MIQTTTLRNGMTVAVETFDGVQSCSLAWLLPGGNSYDLEGAAGDGDSALIAEYLLRGVGSMSSREHSEAFDRLGADRHSRTTKFHFLLNSTMLSQHLGETLKLVAPMVTAPRFDPEHLEPVKRLALQALAGLDDEPQHVAFIRASERHFPAPFNRSGYGHADAIQSATVERLRGEWLRRAKPAGSVLAVAGRIRIDEVLGVLEPLINGWEGSCEEPRVAAPPLGGSVHVQSATAQTHLAFGLWAPVESAPESLRHRLAVRIFGGDTSSRLFTEVREKRGLCYSVGSSATLGRDFGITSIYAGSTHERARQTLGQIRAEIRRLADGVTPDEFARAVVGFKSHLVMQGESMSARASAMAADIVRVGRPRSLKDLAAEVDAVDFESLNAYVRGPMADRWSKAETLAVVGPQPLDS